MTNTNQPAVHCNKCHLTILVDKNDYARELICIHCKIEMRAGVITELQGFTLTEPVRKPWWRDSD